MTSSRWSAMLAGLRGPAAVATGSLLLGLAVAALVGAFGPRPGAIGFDLPEFLAARLAQGESRHVVLGRPAALWLVPIAVLPYLLVTLGRTLVDAPRLQIALQLLLRVAVLFAAALALAEPSLQSPIRGKTVVFVLDVSDSIDDSQLSRARDLVDAGLQQLRDEAEADVPREDRTRIAVVTYAGTARVRTVDETATAADLVTRHDGDPLASDHGAGLRLAEALIDARTEGRVVLVSDATGTLGEQEDLEQAARELRGRNVEIHVRGFDPLSRGDTLVEAVHLPSELRLGETFEVVVDVLSTGTGTATVSLQRDGEPNPLEPSKPAELRGGRQQVKFQARVTQPGPVVFSAAIDSAGLGPEHNRSLDNDRAAVVGMVRGRPRVLLAGSGNDGSLASALRADHLDVEIGSVPTDLEALRQFDLVVLSDLGARAVSVDAQRSLDRYVRDHGGGLIMIGGENSFGVGGWRGTVVEDLLPVTFEGERQREQPKLALLLVVDKSGSMSSEDKLDLVKEAARATATTLDPSDELGIIAFDSRPHVLVRLQPASNRIRIAADIRRLSSGGGTNALPALREAYLQLAGSNALVKHVILLSDGQSPEAGVNALIGDMRDADITVSTVGVGAGAGKDFLRRVANRGRGRFYYSHDGTDVPRIFSRETNEATRNAIVERVFYPRVAKGVQALRGIDLGGAPGLRGIVPVKVKPMSEVLLRTHVGDPLLVRGRRELGRTAAFASDAKNRWAAAWLGWSGFAKLWSQVARDTMRQGATLLGGAHIQIAPASDRGAWRVVVDVDAPQGFANDLQGEVEVLDPSIAKDEPGYVRTVPLDLSAPGRYEAEVLGVGAGQRLITAKLYDPSQTPRRLVAEAVSQVSVPYPAELHPDQLQPRTEHLVALASGSTGGSVDDVVGTPGDPGGRTRSKPLWPVVLWALLLPLMLVDLLFRRISLGSRRLST